MPSKDNTKAKKNQKVKSTNIVKRTSKSTLQLDNEKSKAKRRTAVNKKETRKTSVRWWVYCLSNTKKSYVGKTNSLKRRLRQHRGEIAGGARYTKIHNDPQRPWRYAFMVSVPTESDALKIEYALHKGKGRARGSGIPCQRRLNGLLRLIETTPSATKSATPWSELVPLTIVCNSEEITATQIKTLQLDPVLFRPIVK